MPLWCQGAHASRALSLSFRVFWSGCFHPPQQLLQVVPLFLKPLPLHSFALCMASCFRLPRGTRTPLKLIFLSLSFQFSLHPLPLHLCEVRGSFLPLG